MFQINNQTKNSIKSNKKKIEQNDTNLQIIIIIIIIRSQMKFVFNEIN